MLPDNIFCYLCVLIGVPCMNRSVFDFLTCACIMIPLLHERTPALGSGNANSSVVISVEALSPPMKVARTDTFKHTVSAQT